MGHTRSRYCCPGFLAIIDGKRGRLARRRIALRIGLDCIFANGHGRAVHKVTHVVSFHTKEHGKISVAAHVQEGHLAKGEIGRTRFQMGTSLWST
jgi:hypothetical protein